MTNTNKSAPCDYAADHAARDAEIHAREMKACQLGPLDYAGYALCVVIGLVFGLLIASLTVSAVLSNLPQ